MNSIRRTINILVTLILANAVIINILLEGNWKIAAYICLVIYFSFINIKPRGIVRKSEGNTRLRIMMGGHELIILATMGYVFQVAIYLYSLVEISALHNIALGIPEMVIYLTESFLIFIILASNGFVRIMCTSKQLGVRWRILLFLLWWIPILNLFIIYKCCKIVRFEYKTETLKLSLNQVRKENEVCNTKYPILMVHGIFFRDWHFLNYWGRIPGELIKNGAKVYYGKQQSAAPISVSSEEVKKQIMKIVEETGCEKVNIIAHSKGGLDSRYAISCLGMDKYVASLTTINTPHRGCIFVQRILKVAPDKFVQFLAKRYNGVFSRLGDINPDFYGGVCDLKAESCAEFNKKVLDKEGILYQSVMSRMTGFFSADLPLGISYLLVKHYEGDNDGLVSVESSKWGEFLTLEEGRERRGISHGDMIDLLRENINGFDVREFYVNIIKNLKEKGL